MNSTHGTPPPWYASPFKSGWWTVEEAVHLKTTYGDYKEMVDNNEKFPHLVVVKLNQTPANFTTEELAQVQRALRMPVMTHCDRNATAVKLVETLKRLTRHICSQSLKDSALAFFLLFKRFDLTRLLTQYGDQRNFSFCFVATPNSFMSPRVEGLGFVKIRVLMGYLDVLVVSKKSMSDDAWAALGGQKENWQPGGRQRKLRLERGGVLVLPPGCVHAWYAEVPTALEVEVFWDRLDFLEHLKWYTEWVKNYPNCASLDYTSGLALPGLFRDFRTVLRTPPPHANIWRQIVSPHVDIENVLGELITSLEKTQRPLAGSHSALQPVGPKNGNTERNQDGKSPVNNCTRGGFSGSAVTVPRSSVPGLAPTQPTPRLAENGRRGENQLATGRPCKRKREELKSDPARITRSQVYETRSGKRRYPT